MDVLAAIALATEAPLSNELQKDRLKKDDNFILPIMWRMIISQVIYQAVVMAVLLFFGPMIFGIEYNLVSNIPFYASSGAPTYRLQHLTLMFQTFILMNVFNMFNCRKIGTVDNPCFNVFEGMTHNWWFLIVMLAELNLQLLMVSYPSICLLFMTTPITWQMHLAAFILGLGSLLVAYITKKTPFAWTRRIPNIEEKESEYSLTRIIDTSITHV